MVRCAVSLKQTHLQELGVSESPETRKHGVRELPNKTKHRIFASVTLLILLSNPDQQAVGNYYWKEMEWGNPAQLVQHSPTPCPVWSLPALLQKDNILPSHLGEVIGHGCAHDSSTTDDNLGLGRQGDRMCFGSWRTASDGGTVLPSLAGSLSSDHWQQPVEHHGCHQWEVCSHSGRETPKIGPKKKSNIFHSTTLSA